MSKGGNFAYLRGASGQAAALDAERRLGARTRIVGPCWEWTGYVMPTTGYGQLHFRNKVVYAHRLSYELRVGRVPDGMCVCHRCDNRRCVRPEHLFLGTALDNARDMCRKGRVASGDRNGSRTRPDRMRWGDNHPTKKLTVAQKRLLKRAVDGGMRTADAAHRWGICQRYVRTIRSGKVRLS